ncbi:hypothetical protein SDJN02_07439, partial [Cucurbita argyrosperma subsp. argyrosperma]
MQIILINFRKEILSFLQKDVLLEVDCSDLLVFSDYMAIAAHNEDANVALKTAKWAISFLAYTYAGELPSCAFGFDTHGLLTSATLKHETMGSILFTENSLSRVSVGHSYNLKDDQTRRIVNVETASRFRFSVEEVQDENSTSRQKQADVQPKVSKNDFLSTLGDLDNKKYPIYMTGPTLYTLRTALIELDKQTLSIIQGNLKENVISHVFSLPLVELKKP